MLKSMFKKVKKTAFPPETPILIWDGKCGFCKYWMLRWKRKTPDYTQFIPYQDIAEKFEDIPTDTFKTSNKFIEPDGKIYSGPDSAYRSLWHAGNKFWHKLYSRNAFFEKLSDYGYHYITKNRNFFYKLTITCFGKNPNSPKNYWLFYLIGLLFIILILSIF